MTTTANDEKRAGAIRKHAFGIALLSLSMAVLFGPAFWRKECPGFRDAGHFYFPTLAYTTERWSVGQIPLWNSFDNAGQPLAADATSLIFYPGRALLHLPFSIERRITLFVAFHWLLAVLGTRRLAKRFADQPDSQYFAGLVFALSGYLAGQCFNLVFLIGAAWLPWAWEAWERLRVSREPRKAAQLAIPLSMMVLGGDPQIAYHVALFALLDSISWRRTVRETVLTLLEPTIAEDSTAPPHLTWPWFRSRWLMLALACGLAVGLSAIQVLPSMTWTMSSDRAVYDEPRSIWEWAACFEDRSPAPPRLASLAAPPAPGVHDENLYDFSFAPVRSLEFLFPGIFGELGPHYQNWLKALSPQERWWTSTNYFGLLSLLLAGAATWCCWSHRLVRSAVYVAVIALLSSFGVWGLGALWRVAAISLGVGGVEVNPAAGGLYWFWVTFLPGYAGFRYPSKWLVFVTLTAALLAARGLDAMTPRRNASPREERFRTEFLAWSPHALMLLALVASAGWVTLLLLGPEAFKDWSKTPAHGLYGPFDVEGAWRGCRFAFARTFVVSFVLAMLLFAARGDRDLGVRSVWVRYVLVRRALISFTLLEVMLAVWWGPIFAPSVYWMKKPVASTLIPAASSSLYRTYRATPGRLLPAHWRTDFDAHRHEAIADWERNTLAPRYHWLSKTPLTEARGTTMSAEYWALLEFLHRAPPDDHAEPAWTGTFHPYDLLSARYGVSPAGAVIRDASAQGAPALAATGAARWERKAALPRAWIAERVALLPELQNFSRRDLARRTREVLLRQGVFRDLAKNTIVESDAPNSLFSAICGDAPSSSFRAPEWKVDEPERIELEVELDRPALLVLSDAINPGWEAFRRTEGDTPENLPIYRANRVFRGVCLPAGRHQVVFSYRPWEIRWGGVISLLVWLLVLPAILMIRPRTRKVRLQAMLRQRRSTFD